MGALFSTHCLHSPVKFTDTELQSMDYRELAEKTARLLAATPGSLVFGIAGAQGTGKSTLAAMLAECLRETWSETVAVLSLDDFYLPRSERLQLSKEVHPLLATRGVPGTHDVAAMQSSIEGLKRGASVEAPVFEKAHDDRARETRKLGPARIILCEGWCWGAQPEPEIRLEKPVNQLEQIRDADGHWRHWVNTKLHEYQSLFDNDALLYLAAPSFEAILEWRWQQEQDLARNRTGSQIMSRDQIADFISFYERITSWMLEEMPDRADLTVTLAPDHQIAGIRLGQDSGRVQ